MDYVLTIVLALFKGVY